MRKSILSILLVIIIGRNASAQTDSLFVQANRDYAAGAYENAFQIYDSILDSGYESAALYYNMGNAAYRSNRLGFSILYFEKALKLDPTYEEAKKNLEFVSMYREDNLEAVPELFIGRWYQGLVNSFTVNTWSILSILLFVLVLSGGLAYVFARRLWLKKSGFFTGLLGVAFLVVSILSTIHREGQFSHPEKAIIVAPSAMVKSTPSTSGTDLFILHEGTKADTDEVVGSWVEITISDGRVGWIPLEEIAYI